MISTDKINFYNCVIHSFHGGEMNPRMIILLMMSFGSDGKFLEYLQISGEYFQCSVSCVLCLGHTYGSLVLQHWILL
jgi:hypothetical protein